MGTYITRGDIILDNIEHQNPEYDKSSTPCVDAEARRVSRVDAYSYPRKLLLLGVWIF
jgi:hypothetical protein